MKKSFIAAAVAASFLTTSAIADISITGNYEGTFTGGNGPANYAQDLDLTVKGKSGESTVTMMLEDIGADTSDNSVNATQVWIDTKLGGLDLMAGNKKGMKGNGLLQKKSAASQKFSVATNVGPAGVKVTQKSGDGNATADLTFNVAGVDIKAQNVTNDTRFLTLGTEFQGLSVNVETQEASAGKTNTAYSVGGDVAGFGVTYVNIDVQDAAGVTQDDGILGDISDAVAGKDLYGVVASMDVAEVGTLTGKYITKNDADIYVGKVERGIFSASVTDDSSASDLAYKVEMNVAF